MVGSPTSIYAHCRYESPICRAAQQFSRGSANETAGARNHMIKYRNPKLIRAGILGLALVLMVIAIGLQPERLVSWATGIRYSAEFSEAGGLIVGNDVKVSGVRVGSVTDVSLG